MLYSRGIFCSSVLNTSFNLMKIFVLLENYVHTSVSYMGQMTALSYKEYYQHSCVLCMEFIKT